VPLNFKDRHIPKEVARKIVTLQVRPIESWMWEVK